VLDSVVQQIAEGRVGRTYREKFRLEALVGIGGMAAVYRAQHRTGAPVAIKILHPTLAVSAELRARFVREGYVGNRIGHPAVVRVLDDDVDDDGTPYIVMDLVEGQTLAEKVEERLFLDHELLEVGEQICEALSAAHAAGVVHRDLKPDNLIVEPNGRVRVLDFGIARILDPDDVEARPLATKTGIAFGTPGFIAPEQALGHRDRVGPQADLFALGATLFYLATGEFLHHASTPQELLILVATQPARSLAAVAPHVAPEVAALVDRATQMDLSARWSSADEMLAAIRAVRGGLRAATTMLPPESRETLPAPQVLGIERTVREASAIPTRPSLSRVAERRRRGLFAAAGALGIVAATFAVAAAPRDIEAVAEVAAEGRSEARVEISREATEPPAPDRAPVVTPSVAIVEPVAPKTATPASCAPPAARPTPKPRAKGLPSSDPVSLLEKLEKGRTKPRPRP
jgi:serine/threonine-protein kinase